MGIIGRSEQHQKDEEWITIQSCLANSIVELNRSLAFQLNQRYSIVKKRPGFRRIVLNHG